MACNSPLEEEVKLQINVAGHPKKSDGRPHLLHRIEVSHCSVERKSSMGSATILDDIGDIWDLTPVSRTALPALCIFLRSVVETKAHQVILVCSVRNYCCTDQRKLTSCECQGTVENKAIHPLSREAPERLSSK